MGALRFFYGKTLGQKHIVDEIPYARLADSLPAVLSREEVERFLKTVRNLKMRTAFITIYAAGLRVSELVSLKHNQVNLNQGVMRVVGKGNRERLIPLGDEAVKWLQQFMQGPRTEILLERQTDYLFPTRRGDRMTRQAFWHIIKRYSKKAEIAKELSPHTLRHSFATSLLERGAGIADIGALLGHHRLSTTTLYTHANAEYLRRQIAFHPRADMPGQKDIRGFCELYGLSETTGRRLLEMPLRDWMIEENGQRRIDLARFAARFAASPSHARRHQV